MYLISFQYFLHPLGVASTARYHELVDIMRLWLQLWNGRTHTRTLYSNWTNNWSIGFKSRLCAGHLSCCTLFATIITSVPLAAWHDAYSHANIIPRLARIWRRRTDRMKLVRYHIAVMFPWMVTLGAFVWMKRLDRVLLCLLSPYVIGCVCVGEGGSI